MSPQRRASPVPNSSHQAAATEVPAANASPAVEEPSPELSVIIRSRGGRTLADAAAARLGQALPAECTDVDLVLEDAMDKSSATSALGEAASRAIFGAVKACRTLEKLKLVGLPNLALTFAGVCTALEAVTPRLEMLTLVRCGLTGEIPAEVFRSCGCLTELNLSRNNLWGEIPTTIGQCLRLRHIDLSQNRLSGQLPPEIFLSSLRSLSCHENALSGEIPSNVRFCAALRRLILHTNFLTGPLPEHLPLRLQLLMVHNNLLSGPLPESIGGCLALTCLSCSQNELSGQIPESIGQCVSLQVLGLYQNRLSGHVPWQAIRSLLHLRKLGLHGNPALRIDPAGKQAIEEALRPDAKAWWPREADPAEPNAMVRQPRSAWRMIGPPRWRRRRLQGTRL